MSYDDNSGGAGSGKRSDAHTGDELWNGRSDASGNNKSKHASVPSFKPEPFQLNGFVGSDHGFIKLHSAKAQDKKSKPIGKVPMERWRDIAPMSIDDAKEHLRRGFNVGVRLKRTDLVLDVDQRHYDKGKDSLAQFAKDLGIDLSDFPKVVTGSGGFHYYMKKPIDLALRSNLKEYPGLEFKSYGCQMVAPGSVHPDTGKNYQWDPLTVEVSRTPQVPDSMLALLKKPDPRNNIVQGGDVTPEQLAVMLAGLNINDYADHDAWLNMMMACHHATGGEGREEFIEWSTSHPQYSDDALPIGKRWDSLSTERGGPSVTVNTLYKALHESGKDHLIPKSPAMDDFPDDLPSTSTEPRPRGVVDEWVYVVDAEVFVRRSDGKKWKKEQWKAYYASQYPDGDVLNAIWRGKLPIRKLESLVYLPGEAEFPDGESGDRYNIWRSSGVEAKEGDVTPFLDHLEYLFVDEAEREYVLDYLAMLIQNPGQKINYALLVKGSQGTGKSWIGRLMTCIIGLPNVTLPSNDEVRSNWTGWTEGANLGVIEELMAVGRLDMTNRLKPIITELYLRIENKGFSHYSIPNKLNLMAFTNHEDAVPMERGDRRWLVVFSGATPRDEAYYDRLFAFLDEGGPAAVKDWLLKRDPTLKPKGMAPKTKGKDKMRRLSLGEAEQYLSERLEEGLPPFDFPLVRFEDVLNSIPHKVDRLGKRLRNRVGDWLLNEASAVKHTRYTKAGIPNRPNYVLWSIKDHDKWNEAGPSARIDAFMKQNSDLI
ncbi:MAG: bifunctional DNA primase/polymerase [Parasphingorhabdus sp.]|uniref:bifunctional DNA primase/polymerase n=1 Tax=Parasphingorhabdus sp. TaxID=2709688 RepID=UPI003279C2E0